MNTLELKHLLGISITLLAIFLANAAAKSALVRGFTKTVTVQSH